MLDLVKFAPGIDPVFGWTLAILAVFITGIAKSGFGGGVGILAVPLFAIAFGARDGNAILLPLLIAADTFSVYHHFGNWDKKTLRLLAPGTLLGIFLGSIILYLLVFGPVVPWDLPKIDPTQKSAARQTSEDALNLITGVVSVLYVLLDLIRRRYAPSWHLKADGKSGFAAGTAVGVVSTLAHAAGPVAAIFLLNVNLPRAIFMGTTVIYFFGINIAKLPTYLGLQMITWKTFLMSACFFPIVPVGTWFGAWLCKHMTDKVFRNLIMIIVFITGLQLCAEYVFGFKLGVVVARLVHG